MIVGELLYIFSNKHQKNINPYQVLLDALVKKIFCMPRVIDLHGSDLWERRRNEANTKKRAKGFLYLSPMLVQTYEYTKKLLYVLNPPPRLFCSMFTN